MKITTIKAVAATFVAATAVLSGLTSCKGRTMDNMEPTGDTVEVVIDNSAAEAMIKADSVILDQTYHPSNPPRPETQSGGEKNVHPYSSDNILHERIR
ncbi:MAG: hypothetical protein K2M13_04190 [Muribaculaceae bacterium]|nr:hypothetical protein [Muribaculaceae bacterium]